MLTGERLQYLADLLPENVSWGDPLNAVMLDQILAAHSAGAQEPEGYFQWDDVRAVYEQVSPMHAPDADVVPLYSQPQPQTDAARDQLRHFANAERFSRAVFADDSAFADWVISRSRHVLAEIERLDRAKGE